MIGLDFVGTNRAIGMVIGILIFICWYIVGDYLTRGTQFRTSKQIRQTLLIGYWTRILVSFIFPIGAFLDMFAGLLAAPLVGFEPRPASHQSILQVVVMTLVTGVVINFFLLGYMTVVYFVLYPFQKRSV